VCPTGGDRRPVRRSPSEDEQELFDCSAKHHAMSPVVVVALGCCAVLVLDCSGALLARRFGFDYANLAPASIVVYAATGFLAAWAGSHWMLGSVGGAAAAATDATVGWRLARVLKVDREDAVTPNMEMGVATLVTLAGAAIGTVAGVAA
jgi:hypothetical protein